jgi:Zn finger protein HypA/HybF involved in hydrogenase expression
VSARFAELVCRDCGHVVGIGFVGERELVLVCADCERRVWIGGEVPGGRELVVPEPRKKVRKGAPHVRWVPAGVIPVVESLVERGGDVWLEATPDPAGVSCPHCLRPRLVRLHDLTCRDCGGGFDERDP